MYKLYMVALHGTSVYPLFVYTFWFLDSNVIIEAAISIKLLKDVIDYHQERRAK